MNRLTLGVKRLFCRFFPPRAEKPAVHPLHIEGIDTPMTPVPDDAELAAHALFESLLSSHSHDEEAASLKTAIERDPRYYRRVAERIRQERTSSMLRAVRFVAFCEQELRRDLPLNGPKSLALLEAELYKRLDTVEREGGDLLRRWQHCLADIIVRKMSEIKN